MTDIQISDNNINISVVKGKESRDSLLDGRRVDGYIDGCMVGWWMGGSMKSSSAMKQQTVRSGCLSSSLASLFSRVNISVRILNLEMGIYEQGRALPS